MKLHSIVTLLVFLVVDASIDCRQDGHMQKEVFPEDNQQCNGESCDVSSLLQRKAVVAMGLPEMLKTLIITVPIRKQNVERMHRLRASLSSMGLAFEEVHAANMEKYCPADISNNTQRKAAGWKLLQTEWHGRTLDLKTFDLGLHQMASYLGHLRAWQRVVELGSPAMVLEDDAELTDANSLIRVIRQARADGEDVVMLEQRHCRGATASGHLESNAPGTSGYWIDPKAAQALLDNFPLSIPVDWAMNKVINAINVSATCPNVFPVQQYGGEQHARTHSAKFGCGRRVAGRRVAASFLLQLQAPNPVALLFQMMVKHRTIDSDLEMLQTLCEHPRPTPDFKKNALVAMAGALNSMDAPYNIHAGTVLGLVRGCYIFDSDLDFVVDRDWLKDNVDKAVSAILGAGFVPNDTFGKIDAPGFERSWNINSLVELGAEEQRVYLRHAIEMHLGNRTKAISFLHRDDWRTGIRVDLFTISRTLEYYEWGLWLENEATGKQDVYCPCTAKFTHTATFRWFGVDVKIPLPLKDGLISLYGEDYMTPHHWTWNVEPFTVGSCHKTRHNDVYSRLLPQDSSQRRAVHSRHPGFIASLLKALIGF